MIKTILFSILLGVCLADHHDEAFDYYDMNAVFNKFYVSCGSPEDPYMRITYGGDAYSVYAAAEPEACKAEEVAPAVFLMDIKDYGNTDCPVANISTGDPDAPVRTLDVVVQSGTVRKWNDEFKQITCNYGLGGQTSNQDGEVDADEGAVDKQPVWQDAVNMTETTTDTVHLHVFDTSNTEITEAVLGNYIQLRAFLANDTDTENSIKIFNCRAYDEDLEYYFVIGGCGEGDVMPKNRGFRTGPENAVGYTNVSRVARSTYFKSFLLPDKHHLTFECDYILCNAADCDGFSCANSIMTGGEAADDHAHERRKRAVDSYSHYNPASPADAPTAQRPTIRSTRVKILPQENEFYRISSNDLVHGEETTKHNAVPAEVAPSHVPDFTHYLQQPEPTIVRESVPAESSELGADVLLGLDLVTVGLISGLCVLGLLLIVAMTCLVVVCRRQSPATHAYYHHRDTAPLYNGSPVATPYKA